MKPCRNRQSLHFFLDRVVSFPVLNLDDYNEKKKLD